MEDVLREDSYGPLCLDSCLSRACTCRAVRERDVQKEGRKKGRKEGRKEGRKNAPTETGPPPQSP